MKSAPSIPSKEEPRRDDSQKPATEQRAMCDHICLLPADHVEKGEHHFYGYILPSPLIERDRFRAECELLRAIAEPALAYVAARERNDDAEPCDWSARAAEVDGAWHALKEAAETLQGVSGSTT